MKKILLQCFVFSLLLNLVFPYSVSASAIYVNAPSNEVSKGRYIYYSKLAGDLKRYDTKTGKKKVILSNSNTNGYFKLSIVGDNLYYVWDKYYGTDSSSGYLYQLNLKTGKKKYLDCSNDYVIQNGWIYYKKNRLEKTPDYIDTITVGLYKMKLDGSQKTKLYSLQPYAMEMIGIGKNILYFCTSGSDESTYYQYDILNKKMIKTEEPKEVYHQFTGQDLYYSTIKVKQGNTIYDIKKGKLYKKEKGKPEVQYPVSGVSKFTVFKDYIYVTAIVDYYTEKDQAYNIHTYCVNKDGTSLAFVDRFSIP